MAWEVEIDDKVQDQKFSTEEEASQFAANQRGQNWSMKIDVRLTGGEQRAANPRPPMPGTPEYTAAASQHTSSQPQQSQPQRK